ncbi:alpha/beta hydrolase family protein [Virgisporangium aurantiacum]|nr:alpha/beta fold hydrolase [Virgisporangium aurantiacum]
MPELTKVRDLRAGIWVPADHPQPLPGLVVVDGSGDGAFDDFGDWPARLAGCGAAVLVHDKPGCGGSPGHWTDQTIDDRAEETLAAMAVLRRHPAVAGRPVGLLGISQGGWVSLRAAAQGPVDFVVTLSGPGVGPAAQERVRIERELQYDGVSAADVREALGWVDERTRRLIDGEPVTDVIAHQSRFADRPWFTIATQHFDDPATMRFLAGILAFDPVRYMPDVTCPVLALFGAADPLVPVPESVVAFATHLRETPGIAVFPGADHGLFTAPPDPTRSRADQLAPGFLPMLTGFLAARGLERV